MINLRVNLPHPEDEDLIRRCIEYLYSDSTGASVRPLGRYGYTDSRLYLVYCAPNDGGRPFVVKTDRPEVIQREVRGAKKLTAFFAGAYSARPIPRDGAPEAVIYPLVAVDGQEKIRELRELVYLPSGARENIPSAPDLLQAVYKECSTGMWKDPPKLRITMGEEYKWYLRNEPIERLLNDPLPQLFADSSSIDIYGDHLRDPDRIFNAVCAVQIETVGYPVHGDLHPNNVLFGPHYAPVIIDYAYGESPGHFVKDFALMECSLRFLLPPPLLEPNTVTRFDDMLLEEYGYLRRDKLTAKGRTAEVLTEMAAMVRIIREECRKRHPLYDFEEYQFAQYMILRGLLRLLPYQGYRTLRAFCGLADKLEQVL